MGAFVGAFRRATAGTTLQGLLLLLLVASSALVSPVSGGMIDLVCSAEVENVGRITVPDDHTYFLKLTCTTCRSEFPNAVGVSSDMVVEGIRGASVTVQLKCKGCDRQHDITIQPFEAANAWVPDSKNEWQRLATFECRGVDPVDCEVRDGFIVAAEDGTKYDDVDLSDEWMDVDEKGIPVSVSAFKYKLTAHKADKKKGGRRSEK